MRGPLFVIMNVFC